MFLLTLHTGNYLKNEVMILIWNTKDVCFSLEIYSTRITHLDSEVCDLWFRKKIINKWNVICSEKLFQVNFKINVSLWINLCLFFSLSFYSLCSNLPRNANKAHLDNYLWVVITFFPFFSELLLFQLIWVLNKKQKHCKYLMTPY